jgi:beta-1,3-glucuronyltransferase
MYIFNLDCSQIQGTKGVSAWPVGCLTEIAIGSPIVQGGRVIGFHDGWIGGRRFPMDFAGFAINMDLLHKVFAIYTCLYSFILS